MTSLVKKICIRSMSGFHCRKLSEKSSSDERNIFDISLKNIPQREKEAIRSNLISQAEKLILTGNGIHPYIPGVGLCQKQVLTSGKEISIVYPACHFRKIPFPMKNVAISEKDGFSDYESDPFNNVFKKTMERHQKRNRFYHTFLKNMPSITIECINASEYYFEEGLRKVRPYFLVFDAYLSNLKEPIILVDYFTSLLGESFGEYQNLRVKLGLVYINFEKASSASQMLYEGDHVSSLIHYHERPVLDQEIKVVFEDDDILVVNKPASLVVHPRTGYRLNSLVYILAKEMGYMNLRPIHRIDKLTSGVMIFAKKAEVANRLQNALRLNQTKKEYIALVDGKFPSTPDSGIVYNRSLDSFKVNSEKIEYYNYPKDSETTFHKIKEYEIESSSGPCYYSLVRCLPRQGRTHQIRLHLLQIGHPIVNDYLYNDKDISSRYRPDPNDIQSAISKIYRNYGYSDEQDIELGCDIETKDSSLKSKMSWKENLTYKFGTNVPFCLECQMGGYTGQRLEAESDPMFMCLHAWKHDIQFLGKTFEAELPNWATDKGFIYDFLKERTEKVMTA